MVLSDLINTDSKILEVRDPRDRVQKVAPWLEVDGDPYPVAVDGKVLWIVDGYTTTAQYPDATPTSFGDATADTLTTSAKNVSAQAREQVNYIRNSVKATVDAYDGTVTLYQWDKTDPIVQTWMKAFPGTVQPAEAMPAGPPRARALPRGHLQGAAPDPREVPRDRPDRLLQRPGLLDRAERPDPPDAVDRAAAVLPAGADAGAVLAGVLADDDVRAAEAQHPRGVHGGELRPGSRLRQDPRPAAAEQHDHPGSRAGAEQLRVRPDRSPRSCRCCARAGPRSTWATCSRCRSPGECSTSSRSTSVRPRPTATRCCRRCSRATAASVAFENTLGEALTDGVRREDRHDAGIRRRR